MDRLILRQYVLGFILSFMTLGLILLSFLSNNKDIIFSVSAVFAPIMLLLGKGIIDSDESAESEE